MLPLRECPAVCNHALLEGKEGGVYDENLGRDGVIAEHGSCGDQRLERSLTNLAVSSAALLIGTAERVRLLDAIIELPAQLGELVAVAAKVRRRFGRPGSLNPALPVGHHYFSLVNIMLGVPGKGPVAFLQSRLERVRPALLRLDDDGRWLLEGRAGRPKQMAKSLHIA
eukprot:scaffold16913_cov69-Phaeocystis_antarctica.AAC.4